MELQVDANVAISRHGLGKLRHLDLSYLWLPSIAGSNMADLRTNLLEKDKIDRHMTNLGCVRFDR